MTARPPTLTTYSAISSFTGGDNRQIHEGVQNSVLVDSLIIGLPSSLAIGFPGNRLLPIRAGITARILTASPV